MLDHNTEKTYHWTILLPLITIIAWLPLECSAQGGQPLPVDGITINITKFKYDLLEDDTLIINASYKSTPKARFVIWLKDDNPYAVTRVSGAPGLWLRCSFVPVFNVTCNSSGEYRIFINNTLGYHYSYPVEVNVTTPECRPATNNPHCLHPPSCNRKSQQNVTICEQGSVTLEVSLDANPPITFVDWTHNGVPINRSDPRYHGGDVNSPSLTISPVLRSDAGTYEVVANNSIGPLARSCSDCYFTLIVDWPPDAICNCSTSGCIIVNEMDTCYLPVTIIAHPPISYFAWFKENQRLDNSSGRFVYGNALTPSLSVMNTHREDNGTYSIYMNNTCGALKACRCNCCIQYPPNNTCGYNQSVCIGSSVTLPCTASAVPDITNVTWTRDGITVDVSMRRFRGGTVATPSLTINPVGFGDGGAYQCHVTNPLGSANCSLSLHVFKTPDVAVATKTFTLTEGQTSSIGGSVDMRVSPPPVVVQWFKDAVHIDTNSDRYQHGDTVVPSLTIKDIRREDAGIYSIGAINSVGDNQSDTINVVVEYPPVIKVRYTNYGVPRGLNITLWCTVDSNPPVPNSNVTWIRDGAFVLPSTFCRDIRPNLKLCNVDTDTAGIYMCRAGNRIATRQSVEIHVDVRRCCETKVNQVRLLGGTSPSKYFTGRLSLCVCDTCGSPCGKHWGRQAGQLACKQLGFGENIPLISCYENSREPITIGHVRCEAEATALSQCEFTSISDCPDNCDIWIDCDPKVTTTPSKETTAMITITTANPALSTEPVTEKEECPAATITNTDLNLTVIVALAIALGFSLIINITVLFCMCCQCSSTVKCKSKCCKKADGEVGDEGEGMKCGICSCFLKCCPDSGDEEKTGCMCFSRSSRDEERSEISEDRSGKIENKGVKKDKKNGNEGGCREDPEGKNEKGKTNNQHEKRRKHVKDRLIIEYTDQGKTKEGLLNSADPALDYTPRGLQQNHNTDNTKQDGPYMSDTLPLLPTSTPPASSTHPGLSNTEKKGSRTGRHLEESRLRETSDSSSQSDTKVKKLRRKNKSTDEDIVSAIEGRVSQSGDKKGKRSRSEREENHRHQHKRYSREKADSQDGDCTELPGGAEMIVTGFEEKEKVYYDHEGDFKTWRSIDDSVA